MTRCDKFVQDFGNKIVTSFVTNAQCNFRNKDAQRTIRSDKLAMFQPLRPGDVEKATGWKTTLTPLHHNLLCQIESQSLAESSLL